MLENADLNLTGSDADDWRGISSFCKDSVRAGSEEEILVYSCHYASAIDSLSDVPSAWANLSENDEGPIFVSNRTPDAVTIFRIRESCSCYRRSKVLYHCIRYSSNINCYGTSLRRVCNMEQGSGGAGPKGWKEAMTSHEDHVTLRIDLVALAKKQQIKEHLL